MGEVVLLRRFPLKSAGGEHPERVDVGPSGLAHDRAFAVVGADGEPLRTRDHPWLAGLTAAAVTGAQGGGGEVSVRVGGEPLTGPALERALARRGGAGARLARPPGHGGSSGAAVHLVSEHAERDPHAPTDCDLGHRANLVLRLEPPFAPGAERSWVGRRLRVGGAVLALTRTPRRCLGIYAEVLEPGPVALGDPVLLLG